MRQVIGLMQVHVDLYANPPTWRTGIWAYGQGRVTIRTHVDDGVVEAGDHDSGHDSSRQNAEALRREG